VLCSVAALPVHAETKLIMEKRVSFAACLAYIRGVASDLGTAPINIVETTDLRIVRFRTNDGSGTSFLVTCSRPDMKLTVNQSSG
jgi:hypothetical protein